MTLRPAACTLLAAFASAISVSAQSLTEFEKTLTEHTLSNGMKFILVERHDAPVVAFHLYADVGAVNEDVGISGMAHMFEHMAFKGTAEIGSKDYTKEKEALARVDEANAALLAEKHKGERADPKRLEELRSGFQKAQASADQWVVSNEFARAIEQAGGVGLNAQTSNDSTRYFFSLPANKLELWFSLESARFLSPVLREFYRERDVVIEERRASVESNPVGRLVEEFLAVAYMAHSYSREAIGWRSDLENLTRAQAEKFFVDHYSPANLTAVIVGDIRPRETLALAETYFGRIPARPLPDPIWTVEPPQGGERRTRIYAPAQPTLVVGYHKPSLTHPDDAVFDAVQDIVAGGRTSRLYRALVQDQRVAVAAGGFPGFPDTKYPNLFLFYTFAAPGHTNEDNEKALLAEIDKLKNEGVTEEELTRVKTRARVGLIRQLGGSSGLAAQLAAYQALTGDWRNLFKSLDAIDKVTREDVQRVARTYFTDRNRTVGYLIPETGGAR